MRIKFTWVSFLIAVFLSLSASPIFCSQTTDPNTKGSPLRGLALLRDGARKRVSSYDRTGGNRDFITIPAAQKAVLADIQGPGSIVHIWVTISSPERYHLRTLVLRMYWDGEREPSVESPIGDFFGLGYGQPYYWWSQPLAVTDRALNCFFPMPFSQSARVEVTNEGQQDVRAFYYYIDYETYDHPLPDNVGRFHAQWRRQMTTRSEERVNTTGANNYVIMEAEGRGHYVGVVMHIQGLRTGWWGEGDDMIFIDGDGAPTLHGTGLEDYFCGAWNFNELNREYLTPYFGYLRKGNSDYTGWHSMYRFHIEDPISFRRSIRVTIEHGHANDRADDYSSVAYWYQTEPHKPFPKLAEAKDRMPIDRWAAVPER